MKLTVKLLLYLTLNSVSVSAQQRQSINRNSLLQLLGSGANKLTIGGSSTGYSTGAAGSRTGQTDLDRLFAANSLMRKPESLEQRVEKLEEAIRDVYTKHFGYQRLNDQQVVNIKFAIANQFNQIQKFEETIEVNGIQGAAKIYDTLITTVDAA